MGMDGMNGQLIISTVLTMCGGRFYRLALALIKAVLSREQQQQRGAEVCLACGC